MNDLQLFNPMPRVILDRQGDWQVTYLYRHATHYTVELNARTVGTPDTARKFQAELKRTIYGQLAHNIYEFAGEVANSATDPSTGGITKPAYDLLVEHLYALAASIPAFPLWHPNYSPPIDANLPPIIPFPQIIETNPPPTENTMSLQVSFTWRLEGTIADLSRLEQHITDNRANFQAHIYAPVRDQLRPIIGRFTQTQPLTDQERQDIFQQLIAISNNPLREEQ